MEPATTIATGMEVGAYVAVKAGEYAAVVALSPGVGVAAGVGVGIGAVWSTACYFGACACTCAAACA